MKFSVLGSGSKGNSIFVESGSTAILVDGGFSGREIAERLSRIDRDMSCLKAVFVTHEHHDHISGVGVVSRRCRVPVFANEGTFRGAGKRLTKLFKQSEFETGEAVSFDGLQIRSFAISHDTADPVGFVIDDGKSRLGICTDTGIPTRLISRRMAQCDALVVEFNHDPVMLKNGPYPQSLKQRVNSSQGHLSNSDGAGLLDSVIHDGLCHVVLAHLSETNNHPEIAYREAEKVVRDRLALSVLSISEQQRPTELFEI
ncbi:MAG: MBL fold metallo-hydrolase [Desulfofustis sp.]|nr:MBL fold metallo-hydrolase [Desulfofustis sp.]